MNDSENTELKPHEQRVYDEYIELCDRRQKLIAFINESPIFADLPCDERDRLEIQHSIMGSYVAVLRHRLQAIGIKA